MKRNLGFTIVELIIVILLLGITASIVGPRFTNATTFMNRANKDKIQFALKAAQKTAMSQRRDIFIMMMGSELTLCYVNSNPCPLNQKMRVNNKPYVIELEGSGIAIPTFKFNSLGNTGTNRITIPIGSKNIYIEEESGFIHD